MRLNNKIAIVTGGARGIGKAVSELFAKEGATVIIWDLLEEGANTAGEINSAGGKAEYFKISVTDKNAILENVKHVAEKYERIDILINNAGITRDRSFMKMSDEEWQSVIDVNLTGVFNCTKARRAIYEGK